MSEKHLICISPAQSMKETVTLSVSMNSVDFVTSSGIVFTYTEIPSIIKISPTTGYTRGARSQMLVLTIKIMKLKSVGMAHRSSMARFMI